MTNNTTANNTIDPSQLVAGQMLAQQREKLGLSVEECADTLKLSVTKIKALESGDSKPFVSETFIRGYLKSYAKLLGLSKDEVIDGYQSQKAGASCIASSGQSASDSTTSKWWLPYIVGIVIIVLWFAMSSQLESQKKRAAELQAEEVSLQHDVVTPILPAAESITLAVDEGDLLSVEVELDTITTEVDDISIDIENTESLLIQPEADSQNTLDESTPIPVDTGLLDEQLDVSPPLVQEVNAEEQAVSGNDRLLFTFTEACWVEIVDADNATIMSSLRAENTELLVRGKAPFFIILGNVSGATLHFNGEPVALDNSRDGRTLRLNIGS